MQINQVYALINDINKTVWGDQAIKVEDLRGVVSTGDKVLSSDKDTDIWTRTLCDKIGKTVMANKAYTPKTRGLMNNSFEFGAALEEIRVLPKTAEINKAYNIGPDYAPIKVLDGDHTETRVKVKIYSNRNTFRYTVSIPDYQIKTAFHDETAFSAFVSSIWVEFENQIAESIENLVNLAETNMIGELLLAESSSYFGGVHAINILARYNEENNTSLTFKTALRNADYWRFFCSLFGDYIDQMQYRSTLFNLGGVPEFVSKDEMRIHMISKYAKLFDVYLSANTFHNELVKLEGYEEVPYWMGPGENNTIEACSTIDVNVASTGEEVEQSGVMCVIFDKAAAGVMFEHTRSDSLYDPEVQMTKYYQSVDKGLYNSLDFHNAIVFYMADAEDDYVALKKAGNFVGNVSAKAEGQNETLLGVKVNKLQKSNLTVGSDAITGTLIKGDHWESGPLAGGEGYFMALKFTADDFSDYDDVKVGLSPSEGTGLVSIIDDPDKNGVFKISDKNTQKFVIETTIGTSVETQTYDLSGLTLR